MIQSYDSLTNRKIRVFISSTFKDMSKEREIIVTSIFPRLQREFAEKSIDIVCIDLRWGIPPHLSDPGKILEICIGEVLKCKPFFLGVVGNRYGYIPSNEEIDSLSEDIKSEIGPEPIYGISITEMEMRAGVLSSPHPATYASFHLKKSNIKMGKRLSTLRDKLISTPEYSANYYSTFDEFEKQVYDCLKSHILHIYPDEPIHPYNDKTYFTHLNFLKQNVANYIPNIDLITEILTSINTNRRVLVTGSKGSGKSAILSYLIYKIGVEDDRNVFFHFTSAGGDSFSLDHVYYRFYLYLEDTFNQTINFIDDSYEKSVKEFISTTNLEKKIYLFIDGINQLNCTLNPLIILNDLVSLNENIVIICSNLDVKDGWDGVVYRIPPLSASQIRQISQLHLKSRYSKDIENKYIQILEENTACSNPLYLLSLLDELRVFGSYDDFNKYFNDITSHTNLNQLFLVMYNRLSIFYANLSINPICLDKVFSLLIYSNKGLTETEIMNIAKISAFVWSPIYATLERFIFEYNGIIRINHDCIRLSIIDILTLKEKELGNEGYFEKYARKSIIEYFKKTDRFDRMASELTFQYKATKHPRSLCNIITDVNIFTYLINHEYHSLISYYAFLQKYQNNLSRLLLPNLPAYLKKGQLESLSHVLCISGCFRLCDSVVKASLPSITDRKIYFQLLSDYARSHYKLGTQKFSYSARVYRKLITEYQKEQPDDEVKLSEYLFKYAIVLSSQGKKKEAKKIYEDVVATYNKHNVKNGIAAWAIGNLGNIYYSIGELKTSNNLLEEAINIRKRLYGVFSPEVAWEYCYYISNLIADGNYDKALDIAKEAVEIYKLYYQNAGVELAWSFMNLANTYLYHYKYTESVSLYKRSIDMNNSVLPPEQRPHPYALTTLNNYALTLYLIGDKIQANKMLEEVLEHKKKKIGISHIYTANTYLTLANIGVNQDLVLDYYTRALDIYERGIGSDSIDYYFTLICIARHHLNSSNHERAIHYLDLATPLYERYSSEKLIVNYLYIETKSALVGEVYDYDSSLIVFRDINTYLTHNNTSEVVFIPPISSQYIS